MSDLHFDNSLLWCYSYYLEKAVLHLHSHYIICERMISMAPEDQELLDRINEYADQVLKDFDPQKTRVSFQLEKLKPIMEEIAQEKGATVEEIFIKYMDLASQVTVSRETKFQNTIGNMTKYGDVHDAF